MQGVALSFLEWTMLILPPSWRSVFIVWCRFCFVCLFYKGNFKLPHCSPCFLQDGCACTSLAFLTIDAFASIQNSNTWHSNVNVTCVQGGASLCLKSFYTSLILLEWFYPGISVLTCNAFPFFLSLTLSWKQCIFFLSGVLIEDLMYL